MHNQPNHPLWQRLQQQGIVDNTLNEPSAGDLWYIALLQGFAGWFAALFMLGFLGSALFWIFVFDNELLLLTAGIAANVAGYFLLRTNLLSIFISQLSLAISLCGQVLVALGLFNLFDFDDIYPFLILAIYQIALAILMPNNLHRILSTWFGVLAFSWLLQRHNLLGLGTAIIAGLFILLSLRNTRWLAKTSLFEPITLGLAIALVQLSTHGILGPRIFGLHMEASLNFLQLYAPYIERITLGICFIYLVLTITKQYTFDDNPTRKKVYLALAITMGLSSLPIHGLTAALLVLITGVYLQHIIVAALGLISLISFFSWYYYNLEQTLLTKSIFLAIFGCILLVILQIVKKFAHITPLTSPTEHSRNRFVTVTLASIILLLGAVNWDIFNKERLLNDGREISLRLAPVDPRSLLQGDYMRLRFAISVDASRIQPNLPNDGYLIVQPDDHNVGQLVRVSEILDTNTNEIALQFRVRGGVFKFATNAFFFEEGSAQRYEDARYGSFRVGNDGSLLLHSLLDKDFKIISVNDP